MNFAESLKKESNKTFTENGAVALRTTGDRCLDFFASGGSLRNADDIRIQRLFADAYAEDSITAVRTLWYIRDREGLGEREVFRNLIKYCATYHPESVRPNIKHIGEFGRWDDVYSLVGTPLEDEMWEVVKKQLKKDRKDMSNKKPISLLAKWLKTADASSENTRKLGIYTAKKLGYSVYDYKRIVKSMRKYIKVVEGLMSTDQWDKIDYSEVPSRAMMIYRNAFGKHDEKRFSEFTNKALTGEAKINSSTLYPYDIVEKFATWERWSFKPLSEDEKKVLEAQWRQLPNYVEEGTNAIVMADVSGSMYGRPMNTAVGLALYFAERNNGDYHNLFMTFSGNPTIVNIKGETLEQKLKFISQAEWGGSTNLEAAFEKVLDIAIKNNTPVEDMPRSIIVVSDMEIDFCGDRDWTFYDQMKARFAEAGYEIPNIVFWDVDSRHDTFHADSSRKGVQLCSGQSATTFKQLMACVGMTPVEMMNKVVNSERYQCITVER